MIPAVNEGPDGADGVVRVCEREDVRDTRGAGWCCRWVCGGAVALAVTYMAGVADGGGGSRADQKNRWALHPRCQSRRLRTSSFPAPIWLCYLTVESIRQPATRKTLAPTRFNRRIRRLRRPSRVPGCCACALRHHPGLRLVHSGHDKDRSRHTVIYRMLGVSKFHVP